jgi:thymidylate synthase (FAD)
MKIVNASYEILTKIDADEMLKTIELAGRICYKSEPAIVVGSYVPTYKDQRNKFIKNLINRGHESVLEHSLLSVKFICNRSFSHQLVRHRISSYSMESQRYCNYSRDKFSNEVTFIKPCWIKEEEIKECSLSELEIYQGSNKYRHSNVPLHRWVCSLHQAENAYFNLLKDGWEPEEARDVLPNATKTEIIISTNIREWKHIFRLRAIGTTGKPHPQMLELMVPLLKELKERIPVVFDDLVVGAA